ncbi:MAG: hypothetical protein ACLSVX_12580 [Massilimicrobiota timonensis]
MKAYVELQSMISQIEVAYELLHFDIKVMKTWSQLINNEIVLVRAVMKKDRERYKKIT